MLIYKCRIDLFCIRCLVFDVRCVLSMSRKENRVCWSLCVNWKLSSSKKWTMRTNGIRHELTCIPLQSTVKPITISHVPSFIIIAKHQSESRTRIVQRAYYIKYIPYMHGYRNGNDWIIIIFTKSGHGANE